MFLSIGISEWITDIKTHVHAMKCLTAFSEAVGPGFIFERVSIFFLVFLSNFVLFLFIIDILNFLPFLAALQNHERAQES